MSLRKFRKVNCRNIFNRLMTKVGQKAKLAYENRNYDSSTNGELNFLKRLSTLNVNYVFDVGASIGDYVRMVKEVMPDSTVYAFEVVPDTYERLKKNSLSKTKYFNFGLSSKNESAEINVYGDSHELSSLYDYPEHQNKVTKVPISLRRGDDFLSECGFETIDLLKIDTEGHDLEVLMGFYESFKNKKIRVVQFEYGKANIISKSLLRDFYSFFEEHGYIVGKIYPKYVDFRDYKLDHEDFIGPNYLAIKSDDIELKKSFELKNT